MRPSSTRQNSAKRSIVSRRVGGMPRNGASKRPMRCPICIVQIPPSPAMAFSPAMAMSGRRWTLEKARRTGAQNASATAAAPCRSCQGCMPRQRQSGAVCRASAVATVSGVARSMAA